ncbi:MAG: tRNA lysidine(34) synthetase TilS [Magnetococcales bacterium]|nr:tRNA lysidine(34) synthetase TilS [Magnetococcales bacterium]|tara:strand:- start:3175 stop:5016 length:1842 start_codon:yes stop_codon:yes gene_type:complete
MEVLNYWFPSNGFQKFWFDGSVDSEIKSRFSKLVELILKDIRHNRKYNIISKYKETLDSKLALIIICDQFSRNIYRDESQKENIKILDELALEVAYEWGEEMNISNVKLEHLVFGLLPYRHTKNYTYCRYVIEYLEWYSLNYEIQDKDLWNRFYKASFDLKYYFDQYLDVLEPKCSFENWNKVSDIKIKNHMIYNSLKEFLEKYNTKESLCVSLSGGVDSMVILHCLSVLNHSNKFNIIAIHINYKNRIESDIEADFLKLYCKQLNVQYELKVIEDIRREITPRDEYEILSRKIRFDFYNEMKQKYNFDGIFVGHHKDDLSENVFCNVMKGRSLLDLSVMHPVTNIFDINIWRGLLDHSKDVIYDYSINFGIPYFKDTTPDWSVRGRLRRVLFPLTKDIFGAGFMANLYKIGEQSDMFGELIREKFINPIIKTVKNGKYGVSFNYESIKDLPLAFWEYILISILHSNGFPMIKKDSIRILLDNITKNDYGELSISKNLYCFFKYNNLTFINLRCLSEIPKMEVLKGITIINNWKINILTGEEDTLIDIINGTIKYSIPYDESISKLYVGIKKNSNIKKIFNQFTNGVLKKTPIVSPLKYSPKTSPYITIFITF